MKLLSRRKIGLVLSVMLSVLLLASCGSKDKDKNTKTSETSQSQSEIEVNTVEEQRVVFSIEGLKYEGITKDNEFVFSVNKDHFKTTAVGFYYEMKSPELIIDAKNDKIEQIKVPAEEQEKKFDKKVDFLSDKEFKEKYVK